MVEREERKLLAGEFDRFCGLKNRFNSAIDECFVLDNELELSLCFTRL